MALRARQRTRHRLILFLLRINRRISRRRKRKLCLQRRPLDRLHSHRSPVVRKHRRNIILIQLSQSPPIFRREHPIQQLHQQVNYTFASVYFRFVAFLVVVAYSDPACGVERHVSERPNKVVKRNPVLQRNRECFAESVEHSVYERSALPQSAENFRAITSLGYADCHVSVDVVANRKLNGLAPTAVRQALAERISVLVLPYLRGRIDYFVPCLLNFAGIETSAVNCVSQSRICRLSCIR